jgi:polyhydroxybutyrate depolymerase
MIHGGLERCWEIFRPPSKLSSPVRVVIDLHGYSGNIVSYPLYSGWGRIAERDGFIVVWPQGSTELEGHSDKQPSWNAGMCCGSSDDKHAKIDDVGFLRKLATR